MLNAVGVYLTACSMIALSFSSGMGEVLPMAV